jgi:hypothetical protein
MINEDYKFNVVYWDDVGVPGWKLSGLTKPQGQQSALKTAKRTVEVYCVWHDIYAAGGQILATVYYSARLRKSDHERGKDLQRDVQILLQ